MEGGERECGREDCLWAREREEVCVGAVCARCVCESERSPLDKLYQLASWLDVSGECLAGPDSSDRIDREQNPIQPRLKAVLFFWSLPRPRPPALQVFAVWVCVQPPSLAQVPHVEARWRPEL